MTPAEHVAQRDRVAASLLADDLRESLRTVYPVRRRESDPPARLATSYGAVHGLRRESGEDHYGLS